MSQPQPTVTKIGIIYARVSTDEQAKEGTSLDNQVEKDLEYAEANGIYVPPEFIFREDFSGKTLDRPELNKVRTLLKAGSADCLIVYKPNRLDRSEWGVNLLILLQELKSLGVELHYSQAGRQIDLNNPVEALMQSISGWQAGEDHRETITKLTEGKHKKVRDGSPIVHSRPPYGYTSIKEGKTWRLEINEPQAQVVRLIFQWYVLGDEITPPMSARAIAKRLNQMGIPTRSDSDPRFSSKKNGWINSVVCYLLSCETYAGVYYYGKHNKKSLNPREYWIAVEVPAIVSREIWDLAQEKKKEGKDKAKRNTQYDYLMRRALTCTKCGYKAAASMTYPEGKGYFYYRCNAYSHGRSCGLPYYPAKKVDDAVWRWLEEILTSPERLLEGLREYQEQQAGKADSLKEELAMVEGLIKQQESELQTAIANLNAVSTPRAKAVIGLDIERIEGLLDALEARWKGLQEKLQEVALTDEQFDAIAELASKVAKGLDIARQDFNKRRQIIELLNVSGKMAVENGEKVIHVSAVFGTITQRLTIVDKSSSISGHNPLIVTGRLVIK